MKVLIHKSNLDREKVSKNFYIKIVLLIEVDINITDTDFVNFIKDDMKVKIMIEGNDIEIYQEEVYYEKVYKEIYIISIKVQVTEQKD